MGQLVVTGHHTTLIRALRTLLPLEEQVITVGRDASADVHLDLGTFDGEAIRTHFPATADRYVLAQGLLMPARIASQSAEQIGESLAVNCISAVQICEHVLSVNPLARIVVLGSESGEKGCFDTTYFLAKAALHSYVRDRALSHSGQQLVGIAPSTIEDSGMTQRRSDKDNMAKIKESLPKGRFLEAIEIARLIHYLLYVDSGYLSNEVIGVNGGKFARMRYNT